MLSRLGKFEILRPLGRGAMGEVYLAQDTVLGREVAIKVITDPDRSEEAKARFNREARAAAALNHPNLVTVHEFGEDQDTLFLAMEYVPGEDLRALLTKKRLSPRMALEVLAQVCEGLGYAHARGVLHRDIKPSNIRVMTLHGKPHAKIMDFGIAKLGDSSLTDTGMLLGTFGYMAPEYVQGGKIDGRADLFAVGVMLYETLAGFRPFDGDTTAALFYRLVHEAPPPLDGAAIQGLSPAVREVAERALAKDPAQRFQSATELAAALRSAADPGWAGSGESPALATASIPFQEEAATARIGTAARATTLQQPSPEAPAPRGRKGLYLGLGLGAVALAALGFGLKALRRPAPAPMVAAAASAPNPAPAVPPAPAPKPPEPKPEPRPKAEAKPKVDVPQPPAPKPAPAPAPAPAPQTPEQKLDAASQQLSSDPAAALRQLDEVLDEQPANPRANALKLVSLYNQGRYEDLGKAFWTARRMGVTGRVMTRFPAFRNMLATEQREHRIAEDVKAHHPRLWNNAAADDGTETAGK